MKAKVLFTTFFLSICFSSFSKIWVITNSGFTFNPSSIIIKLGDTVQFTLANIHDVVEVSKSTWDANGTTPLSGGFSTTFGGGQILPTQLGIGIHYYVCGPHASIDMKGQISVEGPAGIENNQLQSSYLVYPNPTINQITIKKESNQPLSFFSIVDISGKQILTGKLDSDLTMIDVSNYPKGVYFLVFGNLRRQNIKFIKE